MSQTYIGQIIEQVNLATERCGPILLYGENIDTGSRIAGLARGLTVNPAGRIQNVGNCELTHMGVGFGIMIDGGNAAVFMKQIDFLLLGLDQLVNTYNFIRTVHPVETLGSFTIFLIVCDQGYQGPQSSFNGPGDFASMANINAFCLNAAQDVRSVVGDQFVAPGFRMICLSQRVFAASALDLPILSRSADNAIFHYRSGDDVTLVCYNFSLRDGVDLADRLSRAGVTSDLFHVNYVADTDVSMLAESCGRTGRLVLIDDSKSIAKFGDALVTELRVRGLDCSVLSLGRRGATAIDIGVSEDRFIPNYDTVRTFVAQAR